MARRCGIKNGKSVCQKPRANWWRAAMGIDWYGSSGGGVDLDTSFDTLNLQSNSAANFTLLSNAVSQWNDLSPAARHATQGTAANRPLYNGGEILWDGSNDFLTLASEIGLSTFSLYVVFKKTVVNATSNALFGSDGPGNNFGRFDGNGSTVARQWTLNDTDRPATANFTGVWRMGGEEQYNVFSFRRTNGTITAKLNDRTLIRNSLSANQTFLTYIKYIGSGLSSLFHNGIIRAFCVHSTVFTDEEDLAIRNAFYARYGILSTAQNKVIGLGDSNTQGGAVATSFPSYLQQITTVKSIPYVNTGIAGENAAQALSRAVSQIVSRPYTDNVIIMFGPNDITAGHSAATFGTNMGNLASALIGAGIPAGQIILAGPPYQSAGANAATLTAYNNEITTVASSLGCVFGDILTEMRNHGTPDSLLGDTIHLNGTGQTFAGNYFSTLF